ncbi:hypothetical protein NFI96_007243, partial [Prochilodus magdalenae]
TIKLTVRVEPQSSVYTGDTVTLTCELPSPPDWAIYWKKDGQDLQPPQNTYSITVSDPGEYQCGALRGGVYTEYSVPVRITVRASASVTSLTALGSKLFLNLVVLARVFWYLFPEGRDVLYG